MPNYLIATLILFHSLLPARTVQTSEPPLDPPRQPLQLCQNWDGIAFTPEEVPEGQLRFAMNNGQPRWGFHGRITATCTLPWMRSRFDLAEVSFLDAGHVVSLWVALGVVLWDQDYLPTGPGGYTPDTVFSTFRPGTPVQVYLQGPQVFADHIDWSYCHTVFCRIGSQIDQSVWVGSNQLIEGSYPSRNYPLYGFLFWQVAPEITARAAQLPVALHRLAR